MLNALQLIKLYNKSDLFLVQLNNNCTELLKSNNEFLARIIQMDDISRKLINIVPSSTVENGIIKESKIIIVYVSRDKYKQEDLELLLTTIKLTKT